MWYLAIVWINIKNENIRSAIDGPNIIVVGHDVFNRRKLYAAVFNHWLYKSQRKLE